MALPAIYAQSADIIPFEPEVVRLSRVVNTYATREEWLHAAIRMLRPMFAASADKLGLVRETRDDQGNVSSEPCRIPEKVRVAIGWCSSGRKSRAIGECWTPEASEDKHAEIFLKVTLDCPVRILDVLVHELIHATVGNAEKHGGKFKQLAVALGLEGKMTATTASEALKAKLTVISEQLGPLPHAPLSGMTNGKPKQTTRLLKASCSCTGEEYIVRITRKALDDRGSPICPECMERMKVDGESEEGDE